MLDFVQKIKDKTVSQKKLILIVILMVCAPAIIFLGWWQTATYSFQKFNNADSELPSLSTLKNEMADTLDSSTETIENLKQEFEQREI